MALVTEFHVRVTCPLLLVAEKLPGAALGAFGRGVPETVALYLPWLPALNPTTRYQ